MICPNCSTTLLMSDKKGVEIDYCPSCRGIWLDKGELEKIIEREFSMSSQQSSYNKFDKDDDDDDDDYHRNKNHQKYDDPSYKQRKKKSFLSDLFDF